MHNYSILTFNSHDAGTLRLMMMMRTRMKRSQGRIRKLITVCRLPIC